MKITSYCFALLPLALLFVLLHGSSAAPPSSTDAIVVLAGGVDNSGMPHETVMRRLRRAAELYTEQQKSGAAPSIVCNGGGTTHKPKWVDPSGYAIPEAALMARQLYTSMAVRQADVYVEGYSDDTIGNAYFLRVMHADAKPEWTRLKIVTSEFQMARVKAIYDWVFSLQPLPAGKRRYELTYEAVSDEGALADTVVRARRRRENASLRTFLAGDLVRKSRLAELHEFIFQAHSGYTAAGLLSKRPLEGALRGSY